MLKKLLLLICLLPITSHASYRWTLAGGLGGTTTNQLGNSQQFPANTATDEFYNYSANLSSQTTWLFDGFLGIETSINNWLTQIGVGYNQSSPFTVKGSLLQGADIPSANSYSYHYSVLSRQFLLEGKLLYHTKKYYPYLFAGAGASLNKATNYSTSASPTLTFTRMYSNNRQSSFSYALGFGVDVDIATNMRIGVGYRFKDYGAISLGHATINTTNVSGTLSQSHLYANDVLAQLTVFGT